MQRGGSIYIMTNKHKTTLYIGVTSNLQNRIFEHRTHKYKNSFTAKYNLEYLVYFESFTTIEEAIAREKILKKWRREKKDTLISSANPNWDDLYDFIMSW
jgi:putative endonuclease